MYAFTSLESLRNLIFRKLSHIGYQNSHSNGRQTTGLQGMAGEGADNGELAVFNGLVSVVQDEKVLQMDGDDNYTTT